VTPEEARKVEAFLDCGFYLEIEGHYGIPHENIVDFLDLCVDAEVKPGDPWEDFDPVYDLWLL